MNTSADYPDEIDLGRKETDMGMPATPTRGKGKPRTVYPTLYIDGVPGLEKLPKEGCVMIRYARKSLRLDQNEKGDDTAGVTLEVQKICLPDDAEGADGETLGDAFAKVGKGEVAEDNADYAEDDDDDEEE